MVPSFTAPPAPQVFFRRVASSSSASPASGNPVMTETPLPPRPETSRATRTFAGPAFAAGARTGVMPLKRGWFSWMTTPRKVCFGFTSRARSGACAFQVFVAEIEESLAILVGHRLREIREILACVRPSANRGPGADGFEPAFHIRGVVQVLLLPVVAHHPGPRRDVGDRVVPGEVLVPCELPVHDLVEPGDLGPETVHGVFDFLGRIAQEVVR